MNVPPIAGHRLRRRLAIAFTSLAAAAALFVSFGFWASEHFIEEATLDDRLAAEMERLVVSGTESVSPTPLFPQLRYYRIAAKDRAPADLGSLPPGNHHRLDAQMHDETVLVRELADGGKAILVYFDAEAPTRRQWLAFTIFLCFGLTGFASLWLAGRLARQVLAPLDKLVTNLSDLDPEKRGQRMPSADQDSELAVITEALNGYMKRLDEVVNRERAFAVAASHELRNPLAIIQSSAELLMEQGQTSPHIPRVLRAAEAAVRDLDTLLLLSRSDGPAVREGLALHEQLVRLCSGQIDVTRVEWSLQPCVVLAPPGAVAVIVTNLLRNALKASPGSGSVRVYLDARGLKVEDDGPGISPEAFQTLFRPGSASTNGGSGMGLYIASVLCERLGWQLRINNRQSRGVHAELIFPISRGVAESDVHTT